jgi:hypothetical protein
MGGKVVPKKQPFKKRLSQKLQPMGGKVVPKKQPFKKRLGQKLRVNYV